MKKLLWGFLFFNVFILLGFSNVEEYVKLKIDDIEEKYKVEKALYYSDVTIKLDSTAQVIADGESKTFYYPKIVDGNYSVIRLILKKKESLYDIFLEIDAETSGKLKLSNENIKIYLNHGFKLYHKNEVIQNIDGELELFGLTGKDLRKAELNLKFKKDRSYILNGKVSPTTSDKKNETLMTEMVKSGEEGQYIRALEVAGILASIFLVILMTK